MTNDDTSLSITPEVKVGELLEEYPHLEKVLLELSPAFQKLQNPLLRRTVAKVTTLRHAARVGGLDLGVLINRLRSAVGQTEVEVQDSGEEENQSPPSWLVVDHIVRRIDVRPILEAGEKPVGKVMIDLAKIPEGRICEVSAPFLPAPMIDIAKERGFEAWSKQETGSLVKVYFYRRPEDKFGGDLVTLE
jgi:hypothetical protein